jgi:hypothetical protein
MGVFYHVRVDIEMVCTLVDNVEILLLNAYFMIDIPQGFLLSGLPMR